MRGRYDFSEARRNPYAPMLTTPVQIRLDAATTEYFLAQAEKTCIPIGTLISAHLRACAARDHLSAVRRSSADPGSLQG